ncbi:hypothetical protein Tco_0538406 [Tanacetum coccineum]
MSKVLQERGFESLPSSTEANPRDQVKSISTTIEADSYPIHHIGFSQYAVSTRQNRQTTIPFLSRLNGYYCKEKKGSYGPQFAEAYSEASHINNFIPKKEKDLGSFTLPCFINNICFDNSLVDLGADISVMPLSTYLNLGLGELAHTRSLDPFLEDYIELNDLNEPFELRRNQGDDLMPTIKEGEVIEEFKTRDDVPNVGIDDYPSYVDYDKKIHIDPYERNIDEYWWRIYKSGDLKVLESRNFKAAIQHEILLINSTWRIYRANIRGVSHFISF